MKKTIVLMFVVLCVGILSAVDEFAGNCLDFDGVDDYVQTTYSGILGDAERSVMAWINTTANCNPSNGGVQQVITDWGTTTTGGRFTFNVLWSDAIRLEVFGNGLSGTIPVNDGIWHHVAVTYDPTSPDNISLYVDGVLDVSGNLTVTVNTLPSIDMRIGKRIEGNPMFDGMIDEVSVWDVALTQTEIQNNLNNALTGTEPGLVSYWQFNEFSGTTASDAVGSHNGTLMNMDDSDWVTSTIPYSIYLNILGSGTFDDPYQLSNLDMLRWLSRNGYYWDAYYIQTADIDASDTQNWNSGTGFIPIGSLTVNFTGTYDGQGFETDNLFIDQPATERVGLFAITDGASITNLGVTNVDITGYRQTGALIGKANDSTISNCYSTGNVSGEDYSIGGIAGNIWNSAFNSCLSAAAVSGTNDVGGLIGKTYLEATVINSYSTGSVNASVSNGGGLVGFNDDLSSVSFCYSTGSVSSETSGGGLVGNNSTGATVTNCFWDTQTSGQATSAGGTGLTTAEMQMYSTYFNAGWDFLDEIVNGTDDYWGINPDENDGYPFLAWQGYVNNPVNPDPPTNLNVDPNTGLFTWDAPENDELTGYDVYLDDELQGNTTDLEWQFTDLINGTTYEAGVSAVYDEGYSDIVVFEFTYEGTNAGDDLILINNGLIGNYPNPFNPTTTISFNLTAKDSKNAKIEIYNLKGQKVKTFSKLQITQSSNQQIIWNGTDENGNAVSSGLYLYRLKCSRYSFSKKMILLK